MSHLLDGLLCKRSAPYSLDELYPIRKGSCGGIDPSKVCTAHFKERVIYPEAG